jgi:hypothetical protein
MPHVLGGSPSRTVYWKTLIAHVENGAYSETTEVASEG